MGNINVFSGPMKCGKSTKIIEEANKQKMAGKNVMMFKPEMDNRFSNQDVMDRNGNKFPAINISRIEDLNNYEADVYLIDEFQFLDGEIDTIQRLANNGKKIFVAGLNLTTELKPFGKMGDLLCSSDNVQMMTARCECCNSNNAIYSYCKVKKTGDILIGDSQYMPVCSNCYNKLTKSKDNI